MNIKDYQLIANMFKKQLAKTLRNSQEEIILLDTIRRNRKGRQSRKFFHRY
jgi:hypothetical protein